MVSKLDQYLRCKKFILITDHSSLQCLLSRTLPNINARLDRWVLALGQYNYLVQYKPGSSISRTDCLSRQQFNNADENISFAVESYINVLRSGKQIRKQRTEDGEMIKYIINNELPSTRKLCQIILASYQDYIVINNILYHLWTSRNTTSDTV